MERGNGRGEVRGGMNGKGKREGGGGRRGGDEMR